MLAEGRSHLKRPLIIVRLNVVNLPTLFIAIVFFLLPFDIYHLVSSIFIIAVNHLYSPSAAHSIYLCLNLQAPIKLAVLLTCLMIIIL